MRAFRSLPNLKCIKNCKTVFKKNKRKESVMRVSVIRTDQIFGCPFQPEDGFEPDYHIHGLVLKRGGVGEANYLSLCSKAFFVL